MKMTRRQIGAALILVLWAIVIMSLLAGGMTFALRQNLAITTLQKGRITAHALARAGVERAIAAVMDDAPATDTLTDDWSDDPQSFRDVSLTGGTFRVFHGTHDLIPEIAYGACDESGKLNLNVATREQLMRLPDMTASIAGAILDWRDQNEDPEPDGIERSYYSVLPHPYTIRNGPFRTIRELLLVRDVTPELFYGEDTNGNGLLDPNEDDGAASPPEDNADGRLDRGWLAYLTVYSYERNVDGTGEKRLAINDLDASRIASELSLEEWAAQSIVKARENKPFEHLVDLLEVQRDAEAGQGADEDDINVRDDDEKDQPVTLAIFKRIVDRITLSNDEMLGGRININTAPAKVLMTLPGIDEKTAEAVERERIAGGGFTSIGDLLEIDGIGKEKFGELESLITVRSSVYRILSEGVVESGLSRASIECVVDRADGSDVPRVLYWLESSP